VTEAWVGLGSNIGEPEHALRQALELLDALPQTRLRSVSPFYRTAAWGETDQPDFLNAVASVETDLSPRNLLEAMLAIEARLGRQRDGRRWGPRHLDLDLLVFGKQLIDEVDLKVPHPYLSQRAFVLVPLHDLAPQLEVPGMGRVDRLLADLDEAERSGVRLDACQPELIEATNTRRIAS
jgi:2-amino-4-hydroxy-6-hydroxymethyldihydropteridine diphosphokinase